MSLLPLLLLVGAGAYAVSSSKKKKKKSKGKESSRCHAPMMNPSKTMKLMPPGVAVFSKEETVELAKLVAPESATPVRDLKALNNCLQCQNLMKGITTYDEMATSGRGLMREDDVVDDGVRQFATFVAYGIMQAGDKVQEAAASVQQAMRTCGIA